MFETIFDLISFIGAVQGVLLAVFLFTRKIKHTAILFLASYTIIFSLGLLEPFAVRTMTGAVRIPVLSVLGASNFLYGPLLYLFVVHLTANQPRISKNVIKHFLPFVFALITDLCLSYLKYDVDGHDLFLFVAFEGLVIQLLSYNVMAIRRLRQFEPPSHPFKP